MVTLVCDLPVRSQHPSCHEGLAHCSFLSRETTGTTCSQAKRDTQAVREDASTKEGPPMDHIGADRTKEEASPTAPQQRSWATESDLQTGGEWRPGGKDPEKPRS